jgi:hypothetical protein
MNYPIKEKALQEHDIFKRNNLPSTDCLGEIRHCAIISIVQKESTHRMNFFYVIHKNSVRTSQETYYVSTTEPKLRTLLRKTSQFIV